MAESNIAGDYLGGLPLTCILDEGAITVTDRMYGVGGTYETGISYASELREGDIVTLSDETSNTYDACKGMPVVETVANADDKVIGIITSSPRPVIMPAATGDADSLTKRLAGQYYRVATVEIWGGITAIRTARLLTADAVAVVPGVTTSLDLDVSQCTTDHDFVLNDVAAAAGAGFMPFHYAAKASGADMTILVGIVGLGTAAT
ncbi:MAG: hypothetical protein DRP42_06390 [Tenericutes bacterium]|nr:MAG: hypothetical protein DRP42_06390 [Mycoplasmatota bacterium]